MKNESIILDRIIKMSLLEQTGLVKAPVNKSTNKDEGTDDPGLFGWVKNPVFWGGLVLTVLTTYGGFKFLKWTKNRMANKLGQTGAFLPEELSKISTRDMLRLFRGFANPANIDKFKKWVESYTDITIIAGKGSKGANNILGRMFGKADLRELDSLEAIAKVFKLAGDDAEKAIYEANKNGAFKGMTQAQADASLIRKTYNNIKVPRGISRAERDKIFAIFEDKLLLRQIQRGIFDEAFKRFKNGKMTAKAFLEGLPKEVAKKHSKAIRAYRPKRGGSGNISYTYTRTP